MAINQILLVGNIGQEPELKKIDNERYLCKLRVATSLEYKKKDGNLHKETQWHSVTIWGKLAELVNEHCKKGSKITIMGRLKYDTYEDDQQIKRTIAYVDARHAEW